MEKRKAVMRIESFSHKDGMLVLSVSDYAVRACVKGLVDLCEDKYGGYVRLDMSPPYRPRSTGQNSQNNLIWRLITIIANETGNELEDVEAAVKERALRRGYPFRQNRITGRPVPASMASINTVEAGYLIDELHQLAAELGIALEEQ